MENQEKMHVHSYFCDGCSETQALKNIPIFNSLYNADLEEAEEPLKL